MVADVFKPTAPVLDGLRAVAADSPDVARAMDLALAAKKPDLTDALLAAHRAVRAIGGELDRTLLAAAARATCARLGKRHPGATIEVRVPPFAAVQIGFGAGSTHTRGTPPNVVEMKAVVLLDLACGLVGWEAAAPDIRASGAHASDAAGAFPL